MKTLEDGEIFIKQMHDVPEPTFKDRVHAVIVLTSVASISDVEEKKDYNTLLYKNLI